MFYFSNNRFNIPNLRNNVVSIQTHIPYLITSSFYFRGNMYFMHSPKSKIFQFLGQNSLGTHLAHYISKRTKQIEKGECFGIYNLDLDYKNVYICSTTSQYYNVSDQRPVIKSNFIHIKL